MGKELTERKKVILHGLVDLYISTGQPVSSSDIQTKYLPNVSSATIRAELNALEAMGYIEQPHTSAGRIPLKDAYKFYVDSINGENVDRANMLTDQETAMIRNKFLNNLVQVEDLSKEAAKIISDVTNYTSFFVEKSVATVTIEEIKLVKLKSNKAVVLIVTDHGMISDKAIDIPDGVKDEFIDASSRVLNKVFAGKYIHELEIIDVSELISGEFNEFKGILDDVLGIIKTYISEHQEKNVFVEGALKMLNYPEYNNVEDAKNFLEVISDKAAVSDLMVSEDSSIEFSVRIGKEDSGVDKCAIVTAAYKVGDEVVGRAGVIGPERMDYKKVIGVLDCMKKTLSTVIDNHDGEKD